MKKTSLFGAQVAAIVTNSRVTGADASTAQNSFTVNLSLHPYRNPNAPEDKFDWWVLEQYVKRFHKSDLTPDYPLVRMSFLEQTGELLKVTAKFGKPKPIWITEMCFNTHIPASTTRSRG